MNYMTAILQEYYRLLDEHPLYQQEVTEEQAMLLREDPPTTVEQPAPGLYRKDIQYSYETRDYAMYLDADLVGFARTYHEADTALDQLIYELISGQYVQEALS